MRPPALLEFSMAWTLKVWFGYDGWDCVGSSPVINQDFDTKAQANTYGQGVLADGYQLECDDITHFFPGSAVVHMKLEPAVEEEEE